jgi:hypothetical protein
MNTYAAIYLFLKLFSVLCSLAKKTQRLIIEFKINMEKELRIDGNQE